MLAVRRLRIPSLTLLLVFARSTIAQTTTQVATTTAFTPGGEELFALNLASTPIGGFPTTIRRLSGTMEVVSKDGVPMLRASERSEFLITLPRTLPQSFTIEVDIVPKECCPPPDLTLEGTATINQGSASAHLLWTADASFGWVGVVGGAVDNREFQMPDEVRVTLPGSLAKVGVSVEGGTIKLYTNGRELYSVQAQFARGSVLRVSLGGSKDDEGSKPVYLARVRVATGAPVTVATAIPATTAGTITPVLPSLTQPASGNTSLVDRAPLTGSTLNPAAPTGFKVAASTPTSITFTWDATPNATSFTLLRSTGRGLPFTAVTTTAANATTYLDANAIDYRTTYIYRLLADYSGSASSAVDLIVSLPKPSDPTNFTSIASVPANVHLSWQPVPGATGYLLSGPGLAQGTTVSGVTHVVPNVPVGINVFRVASVFGSAGVLTASSAWPATAVKVAPIPTVPFLTIANGPGSDGQAVGHENQYGICWFDTSPLGGMMCNAPSQSGHLEAVIDNWGQKDQEPPRPALAKSTILAETIAFADPLDLGGGRRVWCGGRSGGVFCIASTHGPAPGAPGFGDAERAASAAAMNTENRGYSVITQRGDTDRLFFYQFGFSGGVDPASGVADPLERFRVQLQNSYSLQAGNAISSTLDTQGAKHPPHVCLSCHGGRFNTADNSVMGGSLLPIDPSRLVFSNAAGATRADQEARIRSVNQFVSAAGTPMVREYIDGLYGSDRSLKVANTAAVPKGWSNQQGLWNQVVRPYCIMCHMAQTGPLAFASFNDLVLLKDRVQKVVCSDASMPHSELLFRQFWSAGGSVLLPGLLSASLGFRSCP